MGALLTRKTDIKTKSLKSLRNRKLFSHSTPKKKEWEFLTKEDVEKGRPKDAYAYVI
jgi:hypothetical protein